MAEIEPGPETSRLIPIRRFARYDTEGRIRWVSAELLRSGRLEQKVVPAPRDGETNTDWFRGLVDVGLLPVDALLTAMHDSAGTIVLRYVTGYTWGDSIGVVSDLVVADLAKGR